MEKLISYKKIIKLALPVTISQSIILLSGMIDLAFIGPYGTEAIAAVSVANILCATLFNFFEGFRIGTTVLIAKAAATNDTKKITAVVNTGLFLSILVGSVIILLAPYASSIVYDIVGNELIAYYGLDYLTIWLWSLPLALITHVLVGLFRGLRDTVTPVYVGVMICTLNGLLDYLFIYGGWGLPSLGVKGAAFATLVADLLGILTIVYFIIKSPLTAKYINFKQGFCGQVKEYTILAMHIGLNTGFTLLALVVFVYIMKFLGPAALAVHQISLQIFMFAYLPAMGFLVTASIIVPQLFSANQYEMVSKTVSRLCKISFFVICVISSLIYISATAISGFFSPADEMVAAQATQTLRLVCFSQLFSAVYMVLRGALTACKDSKFITYAGLVSGYMVFLPLAYLFAIKLQYGVYGGYMAFLVWPITDCLFLVVRFYWQQGWLKNSQTN